jgi:alkanesulfonate monooxygenase SsuD/methylene tetrahydromethanopterin reductase-like flavin-dependent oxidoreductase (luciferase family)
LDAGADFERRGPISDEYLRAITAAWEGDVAEFHGETVSFRDVMVSPRVSQAPRPPFWVGGNSRAALRRAARLCEGWIPWQLGPSEFAGLAEHARRLRDESGRTGPFELVAPLGAPPAATSEEVITDAARWRAAGATAFHVGVGAESFADYLRRLEWFGREVIPRVE